LSDDLQYSNKHLDNKVIKSVIQNKESVNSANSANKTKNSHVPGSEVLIHEMVQENQDINPDGSLNTYRSRTDIDPTVRGVIRNTDDDEKDSDEQFLKEVQALYRQVDDITSEKKPTL
jgi:5-methylcytosine-specific restriction endonuclease McrBC regulatory subunit McrC